MSASRRWLLAFVLLAAGCGSKPRAPDWQMNAYDSLARYTSAFLEGRAPAAAAEFARARAALAGTGQPGLVARAELTRCALLVATLAFESCAGFEALRADAPAAERAYADYLAGRIGAEQVPMLPPQHRPLAQGAADPAGLGAITDPVARLVAAGVLFRTGRASPDVLVVASDTASAQGWRRPLLAWLGVRALRAEQAGALEEAQQLRRRMALAAGER
ncbi:hypothetical protein RAMLITH_18155 [Ramlibacter sp. RBP-2]|uniref:Lipoprotein n=1 Tax=Ramlibacter lithotrophicus TaxID=2606681 RepID=A0A7X6I7T6_9BURK|nr:hypothetical protein [Ramlibacter lithotrophicus]NKE67748.1 hypothetical protein [Ramlibacter lithotrophicus]